MARPLDPDSTQSLMWASPERMWLQLRQLSVAEELRLTLKEMAAGGRTVPFLEGAPGWCIYILSHLKSKRHGFKSHHCHLLFDLMEVV